MELVRARIILEKTCPLPFIGFFVAQHANSVNLSLPGYVYILLDLDREHYILGGRSASVSFQFDSANIQKRPICSLYVILFSWISPRLVEADGLFSRLSDKPTPDARNVADLLVFDTVQRALNSLECL